MSKQQMDRKDVEAFLDRVNELLDDGEALVIDQRPENTGFMAQEGLTNMDVAVELKKLTVSNYMHNDEDISWFVFCLPYQPLHGGNIYIFVRIRISKNYSSKVICLSFHPAKRNPEPYFIYR